MSEPMFPAPDAGSVSPISAPAAPAKSSRTKLLALGGVAAALVVGGGAYFMLTSGGSDPAPLASVPRSASPSVSPSPSPSPTAKPVTVKPKTASVTTHDPFKPLFAVAVLGTTTTPVTTATTPPAPTAAPVTPAKPIVAVTLAVSKINATTQTATVTVDGKAYAVGIGALFAKNFVLYSVFNTQCVGVLFGDQSVPVCVNSPQTVSP